MLCIVVGAGPGLGAAIARRFLHEGCDLALLGRRPEALAALKEKLDPLASESAADGGPDSPTPPCGPSPPTPPSRPRSAPP